MLTYAADPCRTPFLSCSLAEVRDGLVAAAAARGEDAAILEAAMWHQELVISGCLIAHESSNKVS
jgi:hypothetical protein